MLPSKSLSGRYTCPASTCGATEAALDSFEDVGLKAYTGTVILGLLSIVDIIASPLALASITNSVKSLCFANSK